MKTRVTALFLLFTLLFSTAGCSLTYVYHAAKGQYRLLHDSIPIEEALAGEELGSKEKDRLRLVALIKEFGEKELGLRRTENYQTVYLASNLPPIYVLSAAPKDRLSPKTWWFPIVGRMPYLGFFDQEMAREKEKELLEEDLDVIMGVADAYSTLGWLKDPVTMNLLEGSTLDLVETVLHEMTHTTLYLKGQGEFNEGLAVLVGMVGAIQFFEETYGASDPLAINARSRLSDERIFSSFLDSLFNELELLYNSPITYQEKLTQREKVFSKSSEAFGVIKGQLRTDRFVHFADGEFNNAYLLAIGLYHRHFALFEAALKQNNNSLRETILFFQGLAKEEKDVLDALKKRSIPSSPHEKSQGRAEKTVI